LSEALLAVDEVDWEGIAAAIADASAAPSTAAAIQGSLLAARMPSATKKPKSAARSSEAARATDPRVVDLLEALRRVPALAPVVEAYEKQVGEAGSKFGKNGLKTRDGKLFALFTQGTLVVKLPGERVAVLVAEGMGEPFDPGHGRLMKGWLTVTSAKASWTDLAREAHAHVVRANG
jgi:hypothetical protein